MGTSFFLGNYWLFFSVYLLVFLVGLPLNVMALVVFVGKLRRRPVAVDLLLLNLTISDLLLLLFPLGCRLPAPQILPPLAVVQGKERGTAKGGDLTLDSSCPCWSCAALCVSQALKSGVLIQGH